MRDEQDGSLERLQGLLQHVGAGDIQVVRGLVQAQQRRGGNEHLRQSQPAFLSAGKHVDALFHGVTGEQERTEQRADLRHSPLRRNPIELLEDRVARMQLLQLVLREIAHGHMRPVFQRARIGGRHAGNHLQQRGLAGAVRTDECDFLAAVHREIQMLVYNVVAVRLRDVLELHNEIARARRLTEVEMDGPAALGNLDALDLLQLAHAVLHLLCLRGLVAETLDEGLHMLDLRVLLLLRRHELLIAYIAFAQVIAVVAGIERDLLHCQLRHAVHHVVHELAVVADHDDRAGVAAQETLQPFHAFQVQVVRGLVQQKDLGVADQQLRQRDAHLPAAGIVGRRTPHVLLAESEAEQDAADVRLQLVAAHHLVCVARAPERLELFLGRIRTQRILQRAQLIRRMDDFRVALHDLVEDGTVSHLDGLLLQIAHACALCEQDASFVCGFATADDVQQRGLARAVLAHQGKPVVLLQLESDIGEQGASAERFRDVLKLQDHAIVISVSYYRMPVE